MLNLKQNTVPLIPWLHISTLIYPLPYTENSSELLLFACVVFSFSPFSPLQLDILLYHCTETGLNKVLNDTHLAKSMFPPTLSSLSTSFDPVDHSLKYFLLVFLIHQSLGFLSSLLVSPFPWLAAPVWKYSWAPS